MTENWTDPEETDAASLHTPSTEEVIAHLEGANYQPPTEIRDGIFRLDGLSFDGWELNKVAIVHAPTKVGTNWGTYEETPGRVDFLHPDGRQFATATFTEIVETLPTPKETS